jgi:hypothetical protein
MTPQGDAGVVIRRALSKPLLLMFSMLAVFALPAGTGMRSAEANEADTCGLEQVRGVEVTASVDFDHRGLDYSNVKSVMHIEIPATWKHAPDLLLDTHASDYRQALRCLLGKVPEDNPLDFDEARPEPLAVDSDGKKVVVHYEAVVSVQWLGPFRVGPWSLEAGPEVWTARLRPPQSLSRATWEKVEVRTGGPRALSVTPESATGKDGTVLNWQKKRPTEFTVRFRPPMAQRWDAKTLSPGPWEAVGLYSGSSAAVYVLDGILLLIAGRKLRQGLARRPADDEKKALDALRSWAFLSAGLGLLVYMGDNVFDLLRQKFSWYYNYTPTLSLISLLFLGIVLCVYGKLSKPLLVIACSVVVGVAGISVGCEVAECALLPVSDLVISAVGSWVTPLAYVAAVSVFCMGAISSARRALWTSDGPFPSRLVVALSVSLSGLTVLWAFLVFRRYWDRISWLADTGWPTYREKLREQLDSWWWDFPVRVLPDLWDTASLALLALVPLGTLYVCRAETEGQKLVHAHRLGAVPPDGRLRAGRAILGGNLLRVHRLLRHRPSRSPLGLGAAFAGREKGRPGAVCHREPPVGSSDLDSRPIGFAAYGPALPGPSGFPSPSGPWKSCRVHGGPRGDRAGHRSDGPVSARRGEARRCGLRLRSHGHMVGERSQVRHDRLRCRPSRDGADVLA